MSGLRRFGPSGAARALAGRFSLVLAARLAGAGLGFASQVALARVLGAEALGRLYIALGVAGVLAIVTGLGFPAVTTRFVAQYRGERDWASLAAFVAVSRRYSLVAAAVALGLGGAALAALPAPGDPGRDVLLLGLLTTPALAALRLNGAVANAYRRFGLAYLPDVLGRPILFLAAGALVATGTVGRPAATVLVLHLAGCVALAAWQRRRVSRLLAREPGAGTPPGAGVRGRTWLAEAAPMIVVALFTALFADVEVLLVSPFLPTEEVAVFAVCLKIALLTGFAVQLVHQMVLPDTADAYARGDARAVHVHIRRANLLGTAICVAAAVAVVLAGGPILAVFGDEFRAGYGCLAILAASQVVRAATGPAVHVLTFTGAQRISILVCAVSLGVLAAANALLAPRFGLAGAAVAVLGTVILWSTWLAALARRRTGVETTLLGMATR